MKIKLGIPFLQSQNALQVFHCEWSLRMGDPQDDLLSKLTIFAGLIANARECPFICIRDCILSLWQIFQICSDLLHCVFGCQRVQMQLDEEEPITIDQSVIFGIWKSWHSSHSIGFLRDGAPDFFFQLIVVLNLRSQF